MMTSDLADRYRAYLDCLNRQAWDELDRHVHDNVSHNDRRFGLASYRDMLIDDFEAIPDLFFNPHLIVSDPPHIAARLAFDCAPKAMFLGLPVNGRRIRFCENVFYEYADGLISRVWSVLDKATIEAQL